MAFIVPIVEGHGEVDALPALLHSIRKALAATETLHVNPPIRVKSGSFLSRRDDYFSRHIHLACAKAIARQGSVLILLDCDDACPASLGPDLLRDASAVGPNIPMFIALAYREYETWFIAAARSLRGECGLPGDLTPPSDPEVFRDAKGWLGRVMPSGYDPIRHQLPLTRRMDLGQARTLRSFDRLYNHVARLLAGSP